MENTINKLFNIGYKKYPQNIRLKNFQIIILWKHKIRIIGENEQNNCFINHQIKNSVSFFMNITDDNKYSLQFDVSFYEKLHTCIRINENRYRKCGNNILCYLNIDIDELNIELEKLILENI